MVCADGVAQLAEGGGAAGPVQGAQSVRGHRPTGWEEGTRVGRAREKARSCDSPSPAGRVRLGRDGRAAQPGAGGLGEGQDRAAGDRHRRLHRRQTIRRVYRLPTGPAAHRPRRCGPQGARAQRWPRVEGTTLHPGQVPCHDAQLAPRRRPRRLPRQPSRVQRLAQLPRHVRGHRRPRDSAGDSTRLLWRRERA